jgi:hypothetical protein
MNTLELVGLIYKDYREAAVSNFKWFGVDILDSM